AILRLNGIATPTTTTAGDLTVTAASATATGTSLLVVDNTAGGGTTFAAGNLVRGGAGSVLAFLPVTGALGTGEVVTFTNGNALVTNGILPAWVVAQTVGTNAVDFVTHGGNGVT